MVMPPKSVENEEGVLLAMDASLISLRYVRPIAVVCTPDISTSTSSTSANLTVFLASFSAWSSAFAMVASVASDERTACCTLTESVAPDVISPISIVAELEVFNCSVMLASIFAEWL